MDDIVDLLKIKIERAKAELPVETVNATAAVDWRAVILSMRARRGYNFEQLGDLELETELVLCGLLSPEKYRDELTARMRISKGEANELVSEMDDLVFKKIREELIKNTERKKIFQKKTNGNGSMPISNTQNIKPEIHKLDQDMLTSHGIEIISESNTKQSVPVKPSQIAPESAPAPKQTFPVPEKLELETTPELKPKPVSSPIMAQKMSNSFKIPSTKTDHSMENISKPVAKSYPPKGDPYRLPPE